jgi:hypothetical protein
LGGLFTFRDVFCPEKILKIPPWIIKISAFISSVKQQLNLSLKLLSAHAKTKTKFSHPPKD